MATNTSYQVINVPGGVPIKSWTNGVPFEDAARAQLVNIASLPFIGRSEIETSNPST